MSVSACVSACVSVCVFCQVVMKGKGGHAAAGVGMGVVDPTGSLTCVLNTYVCTYMYMCEIWL